jgi:hypothetical protein
MMPKIKIVVTHYLQDYGSIFLLALILQLPGGNKAVLSIHMHAIKQANHAVNSVLRLCVACTHFWRHCESSDERNAASTHRNWKLQQQIE